MILQTLTFQPDVLVSLCAVCISDNSGGKIALLIIVSALILLAVAIGVGRNISRIRKKFLPKNNLFIW